MKSKQLKYTQIFILSCLILCIINLIRTIVELNIYDNHSVWFYISGISCVISIVAAVVAEILIIIEMKKKH